MTRARRALISAIALGVALGLFHGQLATAVVTRADDAMRAGDADGATRLYERAMLLDPASGVAADRLAFNLSMRHTTANAQRAIAVVTRAIGHGDGDATLLADRAFAEVQLRVWRGAERDFARAGTLARDARYHHFAARMALAAHDPAAARRHATAALADDASFAPAHALLRTLQ